MKGTDPIPALSTSVPSDHARKVSASLPCLHCGHPIPVSLAYMEGGAIAPRVVACQIRCSGCRKPTGAIPAQPWDELTRLEAFSDAVEDLQADLAAIAQAIRATGWDPQKRED